MMDDSRGRTLDTLAIAALVALWAETLVTLPGLPDMVPTSFGNDGSPLAFGSKYGFLLLPVIATLVYAIVTLTLRMKTIVVNVPFEISPERLAALMPMHRFVQRLIRIELLVGFVALQLSILESARIAHLAAGFGWIIGYLMVSVFATVGFYLYRLWALSRNDPPTGTG